MATHPRSRFSQDKRRPYWRTQGLLGKTFLDRQAEGILVIGKDIWTRQEIVDQLHCGNFVAAQNLSKIAHKLQVESLDQLIARFTLEDLLEERGCGETTIFVLMCAQDARQKDPMKWIDRKEDEIVTLHTEKVRALKRQEETRQASMKKKRAARRDTATASPPVSQPAV